MPTNIGVDFGTSVTKIYIEGKGIVFREPTAIAYEVRRKPSLSKTFSRSFSITDSNVKIKAVGARAFDMKCRAPDNIEVVCPVKNGVVSDFTAAGHILQAFLTKVCRNMILKPNVMICVPSGVTQLEKRTLLELITESGAAKAELIEEPLAAALGAGVSPNRAEGTLVVDLGAGTVDIAVVSMGGVSLSKSIRAAGNSFDEAIERQLRRERDIIIGRKTAENIKKRIGCARLRECELALTEKGKSNITGQPITFEITSTETYLAMRPVLEEIMNAVADLMRELPPELSSDIAKTGIYITGGGSKIRGLPELLGERFGIPVHKAESPEDCVALGTGKALSLPGINR